LIAGAARQPATRLRKAAAAVGTVSAGIMGSSALTPCGSTSAQRSFHACCASRRLRR